MLATQGSADTINPPDLTRAFYDVAPRPRFLLWLIGAGHLPPYTGQMPQLGVVERVTIAFLQRYLESDSGALRRMHALGSVPGVSTLTGYP
jgi:fermentation-respiration switch protein FrsA (DUF1100 family)